MSKDQNGYFVDVSMGCYAEIDPVRTPQNILGLVSTDIRTCCHVIVMNKSNNHMIMTHADRDNGTITNLLDRKDGVRAWIKKVCPTGDYSNLLVHIGETQHENRPRSEGKYYRDTLRAITKTLKKNPPNHASLAVTPESVLHGSFYKARTQFENTEFDDYGIAIDRKTGEIFNIRGYQDGAQIDLQTKYPTEIEDETYAWQTPDAAHL